MDDTQQIVDLDGASVAVAAGDGPIERHAVQMILDEVRERYGRNWSDGPDPSACAQITLALDSVEPPGQSGESHAVSAAGASGPLGTDGFRIRAQGSEVQITAAAPRGLLYGAASLLDALRDAPERLRVPVGERTEVPYSIYRASRVGSLYEPEHGLQRASFAARFRALARLRFNTMSIAPDGLRDAIRYRYVPGLEGYGDPDRAGAAVAGIRALIDDARDWGFDVYLTLSEIDYPAELIERFPHLRATPPPDADRTYSPPTAGGESTLYVRFGAKPNLCVSEPQTWELLEGKVQEVTELFPGAAGIALSVNGADSDIYFCDCERCHRLTKPQRAALLFEHVHRGLVQGGGTHAGKRVIFSPYMGAWKNILEPEVYGPLAGMLPPSVVLRFNMSFGDTYLFNALNPQLGAFPGTEQMCDFDPGGEYHGGFFGMQPTISRYMAERMRAYVARGVRGFSFRNHQYHTAFSDLDWYVGAMLAWDPHQDVEQVRGAWARRAFGAEAGSIVLDLLDLGFDVMRKTLYADGINFTNWGLFIESVNRTRHIMMDRCARHSVNGFERVAPEPENMARLLAEKEEAFLLAGEGMRLVDERLRGKIAPRYQAGLRDSFLLARELARVYRPLLEALLRTFHWERTLSEVDRERQRRPILESVACLREAVAQAQANLAALDARQHCERLGMDWTAFNSNKGLYSQDPSVTRIDQKIALPYALQFADDVEQRMQYVPASVFGYY